MPQTRTNTKRIVTKPKGDPIHEALDYITDELLKDLLLIEESRRVTDREIGKERREQPDASVEDLASMVRFRRATTRLKHYTDLLQILLRAALERVMEGGSGPALSRPPTEMKKKPGR